MSSFRDEKWRRGVVRTRIFSIVQMKLLFQNSDVNTKKANRPNQLQKFSHNHTKKSKLGQSTTYLIRAIECFQTNSYYISKCTAVVDDNETIRPTLLPRCYLAPPAWRCCLYYYLVPACWAATSIFHFHTMETPLPL